MKIADEHIINFGRNIWTYGKLIYVNDAYYIIAKHTEKIEVGDVYVMQFRRYDYELMNPCIDQAEADRCNDKTNIGRSTYKVIVFPEQMVEDARHLLANLSTFVLIQCYPDMDGPGQSGWIIDNDVEGGTNKVTLSFEYN
jgi:hypothetical protein